MTLIGMVVIGRAADFRDCFGYGGTYFAAKPARMDLRWVRGSGVVLPVSFVFHLVERKLSFFP